MFCLHSIAFVISPPSERVPRRETAVLFLQGKVGPALGAGRPSSGDLLTYRRTHLLSPSPLIPLAFPSRSPFSPPIPLPIAPTLSSTPSPFPSLTTAQNIPKKQLPSRSFYLPSYLWIARCWAQGRANSVTRTKISQIKCFLLSPGFDAPCDAASCCVGAEGVNGERQMKSHWIKWEGVRNRWVDKREDR